MTDNTEVVRNLYDAFGRKDEGALRKILHPEVEWIQCAGMPGGAHRHGADDVLDSVLGGLNREWQDFRVEITEYLDAGDTVVALGQYTGTHSETSKPMTAVLAHVYDVTEGRITRFRQITDTHEIVKATVPD